MPLSRVNSISEEYTYALIQLVNFQSELRWANLYMSHASGIETVDTVGKFRYKLYRW